MSDSDKKIFDTVGNVLANLLNVMQVLEHVGFLKRPMDSPESQKEFRDFKTRSGRILQKSDQNQRAERARYIKERVARHLYPLL